jgi:hypothetical protein
MNPIPDDELISAYLDGELSEAERARAEAILAEQPEARQLLEDLRALRGGFEGLPSHRVDHTFLDRVMRSAEREMLAGEPPSVKFEHVEGEPTEMRLASVERSHHQREPRHPSAPGEGWQRWRRPLAWAGLALAAGVLIMVVERAPQAPVRRGQIAEAPAAAPKNAEFRAPEAKAPQAGEKSARTAATRDAPEDLSTEFRDTEESAASSKSGNMPLPAGGPAARISESSPKSAAAPLSAPLESGVRGAAPAMRASGQGGAEKEADAKSANAAAGFGYRFGLAKQQDAANMAYEVERLEDGELVSEPLNEKTLIIWCDVDKNVADRPEFRRLLASNGIAWQPENAGAGQSATLDRKLKEGGKTGAAKEPQQANEAQSGLEKAEAPGEQKASSLGGLGDRLSQRSAAGENLQRAQVVSEALNRADSDYVFLEAPAEQLKGVLAEIDRHPELFLSVNVEPAPEAPEQRAYAAYNRGRALKDENKSNLAADRESKRESDYFKQPQQADKPKTAKQQASQTMLGRAQRVMVLPQDEEMLKEQPEDAMQKTPSGGVAGKPASAQSRAMSRSERSKEASKKDTADETAPAEPADKRANLAKKITDSPADASETDHAPDYQQALFIFRRVQTPPAAAVPAPAKDGK